MGSLWRDRIGGKSKSRKSVATMFRVALVIASALTVALAEKQTHDSPLPPATAGAGGIRAAVGQQWAQLPASAPSALVPPPQMPMQQSPAFAPQASTFGQFGTAPQPPMFPGPALHKLEVPSEPNGIRSFRGSLSAGVGAGLPPSLVSGLGQLMRGGDPISPAMPEVPSRNFLSQSLPRATSPALVKTAISSGEGRTHTPPVNLAAVPAPVTSPSVLKTPGMVMPQMSAMRPTDLALLSPAARNQLVAAAAQLQSALHPNANAPPIAPLPTAAAAAAAAAPQTQLQGGEIEEDAILNEADSVADPSDAKLVARVADNQGDAPDPKALQWLEDRQSARDKIQSEIEEEKLEEKREKIAREEREAEMDDPETQWEKAEKGTRDGFYHDVHKEKPKWVDAIAHKAPKKDDKGWKDTMKAKKKK